MAVPSLNSDSPSKISVKRFGAHISLKSAKTATGSVAEISTPKAKSTIKEISIPSHASEKYKIHAEITAEIINPKTAKTEMARVC